MLVIVSTVHRTQNYTWLHLPTLYLLRWLKPQILGIILVVIGSLNIEHLSCMTLSLLQAWCINYEHYLFWISGNVALGNLIVINLNIECSVVHSKCSWAIAEYHYSGFLLSVVCFRCSGRQSLVLPHLLPVDKMPCLFNLQ